MHDILHIGYMPAYGLTSELRFTRKFPLRVGVTFDSIVNHPDTDFKVLVQCEPPKLYIDFKGMVERTLNVWDLILTYDDRLLVHPQAVEFLPIGSWVGDLACEKRNQITYIMSTKILTHEHRMRFMIMTKYQHKKSIGPFEFLMHRSPPRLPSKDPFFVNAKFQIVCENQVMTNMFTEKLIDCFRTRTIPIYYGCTNLEKYFNPKGVLAFNSFNELEYILDNLQPEQYDLMKPYMEENYERARMYWEKNVYQRIEDQIEQALKKSNDLLL
jgi:hypothetical protein